MTPLKEIRDLLSDNARWTKDAHARIGEDGGTPCEPRDPDAKCWCLDGALLKVLDVECTNVSGAERRPEYEMIATLLNDAAHELFPDRISDEWSPFVHINDAPETTHDEILAVIDKAIENDPTEG